MRSFICDRGAEKRHEPRSFSSVIACLCRRHALYARLASRVEAKSRISCKMPPGYYLIGAITLFSARPSGLIFERKEGGRRNFGSIIRDAGRFLRALCAAGLFHANFMRTGVYGTSVVSFSIRRRYTTRYRSGFRLQEGFFG